MYCRDNKGYLLIRRTDGAHIPDGKVRYSQQGANQALWNFVNSRVGNRLKNEYGYDDDTAWATRHVYEQMHQHKLSLDEASTESLRYHIKKPVTNQNIRDYGKARLELYGEWEIIEVRVAS